MSLKAFDLVPVVSRLENLKNSNVIKDNLNLNLNLDLNKGDFIKKISKY